MPMFKTRERVVEAEQFFRDKPLPFQIRGPFVTFDGLHFQVTTAHGNIINLADGDWVIPEDDTGHRSYAVKPETFERNYVTVEPKVVSQSEFVVEMKHLSHPFRGPIGGDRCLDCKQYRRAACHTQWDLEHAHMASSADDTTVISTWKCQCGREWPVTLASCPVCHPDSQEAYEWRMDALAERLKTRSINNPDNVPRYPHCHCLQYGRCLHPSGVECSNLPVDEFKTYRDGIKAWKLQRAERQLEQWKARALKAEEKVTRLEHAIAPIVRRAREIQRMVNGEGEDS